MTADGYSSLNGSIDVPTPRKKKKRTQKEVELLIPATINLDEITQSHSPEYRKFKKEKAYYLIHLIAHLSSLDKHRSPMERFAEISATWMKDKLYDYREHLVYLEQVGIIQIDKKYFPGVQSKRYSISQSYSGVLRRERITSDKIYDLVNEYRIVPQSAHDEYKHVVKWIGGLKIDIDAALDHIAKQRDDKESGLVPLDKKLKKVRGAWQWVEQNPQEQYAAAYNNILYFESPGCRGRWSVDRFAGRLHSSLTNLPSSVRKYLTYEGQALECLDISCSQPLIMTVLFDSDFWMDASSGRNRTKIYINDIKHLLKDTIIYNSHNSSSISHSFIENLHSLSLYVAENGTFLPDRLNIFKDSPDVRLFIQGVADGSFYSTFANLIEERTNKSLTRKEAKAIVYLSIFSPNSFFRHPKALPKRLFKGIYPQVFNLIQICQEGGKSTFPKLLQAIEANIVLKRICGRLAVERPDLAIFTVHDSIAVPEGNGEYLRRVMAEEIYKAIGIAPHIKRERWA